VTTRKPNVVNRRSEGGKLNSAKLSAASRRSFLFAAAAASAGLSVRASDVRPQAATLAEVSGTAHWTVKRAGSDNVKLFLWRKQLKNRVAGESDRETGTILFVHGSSVSATPVFDLQIPGRPETSTMDWFARRGYDTWCVDCEGYGRSDKWRPVNADVSCGADDLAAASEYILNQSPDQKLLLYGASSGALRAGLFAQRLPDRVQRLALDALVWTGEGSPTLDERKKRLEEYRANNRRPIDRTFVRSIFTRDHPDTSDLTVVDAFADAVLALDKSVPTGTYIDMSANLPVIDPEKISVPVLIMRGQWDGIASFQDLSNFFARVPNPDKQFVVMPGIAHTSTRSKNWALVYHLLDAYFSQPAPVYTG
jgi:pimeloyl-ACP methyl ester carboxylesterase